MTSKKYLEQAIRLAKNMVARRAEIDRRDPLRHGQGRSFCHGGTL